MGRKPHNEASETGAEEGDVYVDGPSGIAYAMTPEAAKETSSRLLQSATEAAGQRRDKANRGE